ncbi:hypothetical protein Tco_0914131, partial [Tanacetum coccineum]
ANCNYHQRERVVSGNNFTRVNYNYSTKKAYPSAHKNMAPRAVLIIIGLRPLNTARTVNTAHPKTTGHPQKEDQGYVDSRFSKHMTGNMSYLSDFKEFDGGYVNFGGGAKGGKITGKGTLKTCIEESVGTSHSSKETGSSQDYILMPLWKDGSLFDSSSKNASNDEPQPSSDAGKKDDEGVSQESGIDDQEMPKNSTQDVNTAGPSINTANKNVNTGSLNINIVSLTATTAPLKATHADFFGDETELDMSNITTTYLVPITQNTRIHKDHSLDHVIGDVQSSLQDKKDERGIVIRNKARLVEREYPLSRGVLTQMLVTKLLVEQNNEMSRELLKKIFMHIKRPRR